MKLDLVLRLREARRMAGLTQKQAARKSGVGEKTISSFESGERINSMKVAQLQRLLRAYDISQERFFGDAFANEIMLSRSAAESAALERLLETVAHLEDERRERLLRSFADLAVAALVSDQRRGHRSL